MAESFIVSDTEIMERDVAKFMQNFPFSTVVVIGPEDILFMDSLSFFSDTAFR